MNSIIYIVCKIHDVPINNFGRDFKQYYEYFTFNLLFIIFYVIKYLGTYKHNLK